MQLTQIDRWLKETLIYQTHVYTMRLPESGVPSNVMVEELEQSPTRRYRYRLIVNAKRDAEALLNLLREGNQIFATRVVERNPWYKPIVAPEGKSFFFRVLWWVVAVLLVVALITVGILILSNEELKQEIWETIELFKNG